MPITYGLLAKQNAETSNAIIEHWTNSSSFGSYLRLVTCSRAANEEADFLKLSKFEGDSTVARDNEDGEKLQIGVDFAKEKGVIDPNFVPEPYVMVDVLGKTPDMVADEIIDNVKSKQTSAGSGSVIVLCGLSGTGKGTTVSKLRQKMEAEGKKVVTWSNGNIFRSVTLLAATWCEQNGCNGFDKDKAMTKQNLAKFMRMLSFGKFNNKYDTRIRGLGLDMLISEVQNTELKGPKVSKNIPTVAQFTQGEVILFAANAVDIMGKDGLVVLLEGREQTVNYVRTPHRFTLTLSDESLIGKRRAAQRIMAAAMKSLPEGANDQEVNHALQKCLRDMVEEIETS